ncbi:MAG: hypothetical protein NTX53_08490 [candidate division WOR-3 bacterium]|nr:hypothetical protein [candidate division WOR-3 bacterium]
MSIRFLCFSLVLAGVAAAGPSGPVLSERNDFYLQVELLRIGVCALGAKHLDFGDSRLLKVSISYQRARVSTTLISMLPLTNCILPVEVGWTIFRSPRRYGGLYGMASDVYVEAGLYLLNGILDDNPIGTASKLAVRTEADGFGFGVGAEAAMYFTRFTERDPFHFRPAACVDGRLVTNFRL